MSATTQLMQESSLRPFLAILGVQFGGDIGGYTIYRNRFGKTVMYPRTTPSKPPSPLQVKQRLRFKIAQQNYMALRQGQKQSWELLTKKLSMCATGQNYFIACSLNDKSSTFASALKKTGLSIPYPAIIPP